MIKEERSFTSTGYDKAVDIVTTINTLGGRARIGQTYMDYGAGIMWETILVYSKSLDIEYQAISPREFREMNEGVISIKSVRNIVDSALK